MNVDTTRRNDGARLAVEGPAQGEQAIAASGLGERGLADAATHVEIGQIVAEAELAAVPEVEPEVQADASSALAILGAELAVAVEDVLAPA